MKIDLYYMISALERELAMIVLAEFRSVFPGNWYLHFVQSQDHLECMRRGIDDDSYMVIAEQGVRFTNRSPRAFERAVNSILGHTWDLLYGEIEIDDESAATKYLAPKAEMLADDRLHLQYLKKLRYHGSRIYLVNKWSKHSLAERVARRDTAVPYDRFLAEQVAKGELNAFVIHPFVTEPGAIS